MKALEYSGHTCFEFDDPSDMYSYRVWPGDVLILITLTYKDNGASITGSFRVKNGKVILKTGDYFVVTEYAERTINRILNMKAFL